MISRRSFSAAALLVIPVLAAARAGAEAKAEPQFGVRGKIEKIVPPNEQQAKAGQLARVHVVGKKEKDTETDQAVAIVMGETRLFRLEKGKRAAARLEELKPGMRVEVRFKAGPRILIYPTQAVATELVVLPPAAGE